MANNDIPEYYYKLPIGEDVFAKFLANKLEDFNIILSPEEALKIFNNIIINVMYFLYTHPGNYFQLSFLDLCFDDEDWLCVKRPKEATEDTIDMNFLYKKFCSTEMLKEELGKNLDLFAKAILGVETDKKKEASTLQQLISARKQRLEEVDKLKRTRKRLTETQKTVRQKRKEDLALISRTKQSQMLKLFMNQFDINQINRDNKEYEKLKAKLLEKWLENKDNFPLK